MEVVPGTSFVMALCSCLYLLTISCPSVSGKCRGSWAIHACFGGNGKRSSLPSLPSPTHHRATVLDKLPPATLSQLLLRDLVNLQKLLVTKRVMEEEQHSRQYTELMDLPEYTGGSTSVLSPRQPPLTAVLSPRQPPLTATEQLTAPERRKEKLDKLRSLLKWKSALREELI